MAGSANTVKKVRIPSSINISGLLILNILVEILAENFLIIYFLLNIYNIFVDILSFLFQQWF